MGFVILVVLQKLVVIKTKKFYAFVDAHDSLPFLWKPDVKPYQESGEFNP